MPGLGAGHFLFSLRRVPLRTCYPHVEIMRGAIA
jgi:hypothetical protein